MTSDAGHPPVAVLRDYPLRLWQQQNEYTEGLLRDFTLLLLGEQSGEMRHAAPGRLVELADMFTTRFSAQLQAINEERQAGVDRGLDRMDSRVPLVEGTPQLLERVQAVLAEADEFCASGQLLMLPRPPELVALMDWVNRELVAQYGGGEPTAWPGPF